MASAGALITRCRLIAALALLGLPVLQAQAGIEVELRGVDDDARRNVLAFLSVERYRERNDLDEDIVTRLFNRIDDEVKSALRPYGYYEPTITSDYKADGDDWNVTINVEPGEPIQLTEVTIVIDGEGENDSIFAPIRTQTLLRPGMQLSHSAYEEVKGALTRSAAANGYLDAKLLTNDLLVDPKAHTARADLHLATGPRYRFGEIKIDQTGIRPELMQRFLRFREGDPYNAAEVLRTQFALDDSLYFATVDVTPGTPDHATQTVPVQISATKSKPQLSLGLGYGTDTSVRGTLGRTDTRLNDKGHRLRFEVRASAITRRLDARYDIPMGDPALERFSIEAINRTGPISDLDTSETTLKPSITRVRGHWQRVTSLAATSTRTDNGLTRLSSTLLVPGIVLAAVPDGFLGESLFSRAFYAELIGSHSALGSDADFLRLLVQSERVFDLKPNLHLLLRGEFGTSIVRNFDDLPGIYRFFAGGDRSVRGFAYNSLSPEQFVTDRNGVTELKKTGARNLLVGTAEIARDLPRNLAIAAFVDIGNAFNKFGDPMEYSTGIGLRYRLPVVSLGLDIAKPLSTNGGIRLHLNISPKL
jgi:translocation and assembly module TamA